MNRILYDYDRIELNKTSEVKKVESDFFGCPYYIIDNFYKYPELVEDFVTREPAKLFEGDDRQYFPNEKNYNGDKFFDGRHKHYVADIDENVRGFISGIINKEIHDEPSTFQTNIHKFYDKEFNDYKNNYWFPHLDDGWTALVYLNKDGDAGTNLYSYKGESKIIVNDEDRPFNPMQSEHGNPWLPKEDWKVIHTLEGVYNRCIIFNGRIYHGMAIEDDKIFERERANQVMFFAP
jgi:hypothetical protein